MNTIITVGRQFGSAGHVIAECIADHFGIKCYDRELLARAAKESGFCEEIFEHHDERPTSSFLYNLVMDTYSFGYNAASFVDMPISHKVFIAQFDAIKSLADEGPCVIVGRCADYALAERKNLVRLFICADMDDRIKRVCERFEITPEKAKERIIRMDKQRSSYYNYYATGKWGRAATYDLCVNSGLLGVEGTTEMLIDYITRFDGRQK